MTTKADWEFRAWALCNYADDLDRRAESMKREAAEFREKALRADKQVNAEKATIYRRI